MNENKSYEWGPKGHSQLPLHRKAFPLDDMDSQPIEHQIVNTDFEVSYSEDTGDVIQAVETLDPYLHPKNQILLRALIKLNSIKHDVGSLVKIQSEPSINAVSVKPMTIKEGLEIAQEMSPYLSAGANRQVNNAISRLYTIDKIKNSISGIKTAQSLEIKAEYILDNLKLFIPRDKYTKIKQTVNILKLLQSTAEISRVDDSVEEDTEDMNENQQSESFENQSVGQDENKDEQLSDIVDLLDKFSNKKTE
ncbi:hypothetical protein [Alkalibaculum bacchi]|uniref:hypothetical protein n=1 Tax=Alkalibaculum bacchi TaxID=645887 RepID=UPI0026EA63E2|nr:hypothetical protein [Alkalibaculum bacchi]